MDQLNVLRPRCLAITTVCATMKQNGIFWEIGKCIGYAMIGWNMWHIKFDMPIKSQVLPTFLGIIYEVFEVCCGVVVIATL